MAAHPPPAARPRGARPGLLERPINSRLYRGTWLLVGIPMLVAAFSVTRPAALRPGAPAVPPAFDRDRAAFLAGELSRLNPDRFPGSSGSRAAGAWIVSQLEPYGFKVRRDRFSATIPGYGRRKFENLIAVVPGRSPQALVIMAHRDDTGEGPGANDNASGIGALIEIARTYASVTGPTGPGAGRATAPAHTIVFLASDGGAFGGIGAGHFAKTYGGRPLALVNLAAIGGGALPRLVIAGNTARAASASFVQTAAEALTEQLGTRPRRASPFAQLVDLGFPFTLYEQGPLIARGIPAITMTTAGDRPLSSFTDSPERLNANRIGQIGRAAQQLVLALDQGVELAQGTSSYVYLGPRVVRGWAIQLVLIAALLPFLIVAVDLFARCRRRRIRLAPALRSYRSRLGFWLWTGAIFELFALVGIWPGGISLPLAPSTRAASHWPIPGLIGLGVLSAAAWFVVRERLLPRRPVATVEQLAGHTVALLALGLVGLLVVATNPYALLFVLPSLHAWLWLPQFQHRPLWTRALIMSAGFIGPLLLLGSFAIRYELGLDAPWYLAELTTVGYVGPAVVVIVLVWLAAAGQAAALAADRYAPYPGASERPPLGPVRAAVRRIVVPVQRRTRAPETEEEALEG